MALRRLRGLTVHRTTNPNVLCFTKHVPAGEAPRGKADTVVIVASLTRTEERATVSLDLAALGRAEVPAPRQGRHHGRDLHLGKRVYVRSDPAKTPSTSRRCAHDRVGGAPWRVTSTPQ